MVLLRRGGIKESVAGKKVGFHCEISGREREPILKGRGIWWAEDASKDWRRVESRPTEEEKAGAAGWERLLFWRESWGQDPKRAKGRIGRYLAGGQYQSDRFRNCVESFGCYKSMSSVCRVNN